MNILNMSGTFETISERIVQLAPAALGALGLILFGWVLAVILRVVTRKLVGTILERIDQRSRHGHGLGGTRLEQDVPRILAGFAYWMVLLFFAAAALEKLPLPIVAGVLQSMAYYLPKVLVAVVIAFVGFGVGRLLERWVTASATAAGVESATALGRVVQIGVFVVAIVVAAQQVGLDSGLFTVIISILIGGTLGGMALAFGLGSSPIVSNIMASYYAAKAFILGDRVRIAGIEGTVQEIRPTTIILEGEDGQLHLPARKYCDEVSLVLRNDR